MVGAVAAGGGGGGGGVGSEVGAVAVPGGEPLSLLPPHAANAIAKSKLDSRLASRVFIFLIPLPPSGWTGSQMSAGQDNLQLWVGQ